MRYIFSRLTQTFILLMLMLMPLCAFSHNINILFKGNHLHFSIDIPQNHKIYVDEVDNINIDLGKSHNLKNFEIIFPRPITKETFEKQVSFYKKQLEFDIFLEAEDTSQPIDIVGDINYKVCGDEECKYVYKEYQLPNLPLSENYIIFICMMALLGGFILNFMPCVLPVLSLKIFSIINAKRKAAAELIFSILGIFCVFWLMALLSIWMRSIGEIAGIGMHFGSPIFIVFLVALMTIFVARVWGEKTSVFQVDALNYSPNNIYLNAFISGILVAIFATPCTTPFLGSAIAFAAVSSTPTIILIFTMMGLGFSLPYIILLIYPQILLKLPKPGMWMENMKLVLALLMVGTIFWLLSVLQAQLGFRATFGTILLLLLLKFVSEQKIAILWKLISYLLIVWALFTLPQFASKEDFQKSEDIRELWQEFNNDSLKEAMEANKIVVIDITADWCGTCRYNKFILWDRDKTIKLLSNPRVLALRKDITSRSLETQKFMQEVGVYGIPFNIVFGPKSKRGIVLPTMLSYEDLKGALIKAGL